MLSNIPPVLPILKQPGLIPPTCNRQKNKNNDDYNEYLNWLIHEHIKHCYQRDPVKGTSKNKEKN